MVVKPNTAGARCRHRKVVQNPHSVQADTHDYFLTRPKAGRLRPSVSHSRGLYPAGWCSKGCTRTPTLAGWYSRCCADGVALQKVVPESSMGWCSKSWGGAVPESSMRWCSKSWGGVPKNGVVFQKLGWCSKKWGGVPKLGWCSKKLSQNPHSVYYSGEFK